MMKKISDEMFFLVFCSGVLIIFIIIGYFPHPFMPEDHGYEDFSPLEGLAIAEERADEVNPDAVLIFVQKMESYGTGEWWWNYLYIYNQNVSDEFYFSSSGFIISVYQNNTTSVQPGHSYPESHCWFPDIPVVERIENWTVNCDEAVEIARANETFADFNWKTPGLEIDYMELYPGNNEGTMNPVWGIHFEGNYDDGFDGMYGTSGYVTIDATTGEVIYVWVGEGRHAPPICVLAIIIGTIIDALIALKLIKMRRSVKQKQA